MDQPVALVASRGWRLLGFHDLCGTLIEAAAVKRRRRDLRGGLGLIPASVLNWSPPPFTNDAGARETSAGPSAEDVVEGRGLQVAVVDDVDQLGVAVGDGRQVGVGDHDLLGLKRFPGVADEAVFVLGSRVPDVTAPHGDRGVPQIGGDPVDVCV